MLVCNVAAADTGETPALGNSKQAYRDAARSRAVNIVDRFAVRVERTIASQRNRNRRAAAIEAGEMQASNDLVGKLREEGDPQAEANEQKDEIAGHDWQMQLSVKLAVGLIVMMIAAVRISFRNRLIDPLIA